MQGKNWLQRIAEGADLPGEPIPGMPLIEIAGENRVLIESHAGVREYSSCKISVNVRFGQVCICGSGLKLALMSRERLIISGNIGSVQLYRRGK